MPHAHDTAEITKLGRMANKLSVHDEIDVRSYGQILPVDVLTWLEFVKQAIIHDVLKAQQSQFTEKRMFQA